MIQGVIVASFWMTFIRVVSGFFKNIPKNNSNVGQMKVPKEFLDGTISPYDYHTPI